MKTNKRKTRTQAELKAIRKKRLAEQGVPGKPTGIFPRSLARSVAKATMRRSGWQHINRNFSMNWKHVFRTVK